MPVMAFLYESQVLILLQVGLTLWMLVDAHRRGAETYWWFVILFFWPLGPWLYLFIVKAADFQGPKGWSWLQRRASLEELRYQAGHAPTLASHLALAERLVEAREHAEAVTYLESALTREPEHCQVLYLLAVCHTEQGHPEKALPLLDAIVQRDRCWSDYAAWRLLVRARALLNDPPGALTACRELVRLSPTLQHRCLLAENLIDMGLDQEARELLEQALEDYHYAASPIRRRNRPWAGQAKKLLKKLG